MANEKLLRGNVSVLLAYPEAFADPANPTASELNDIFDYDTNPDGMVFDVSCAILDDFTMNMTDSDTDDTMTICDVGDVQSRTFQNYEVSLDGLRDESVTDEGLFNLFRNLTLTADRPFWAIKRIGKSNRPLAQFLTDGTDVISMYGVITDNPVDIVEDNTPLQHGARFKTTGRININKAITD